VKAETNVTANYQTSIWQTRGLYSTAYKKEFPSALILAAAVPHYWARDNTEQLQHRAIITAETAPSIGISGE
jgi:hypothetical protein